MDFNIVYGNHAHYGAHVADILNLVKYGLEENEHEANISSMMIPGKINIILENFTYDFIAAMDEVLESDSNTQFIIIATEYVADGRFNYFEWEKNDPKDHYSNHRLWTKRFKTFALALKKSMAVWHLSYSQAEAYRKAFSFDNIHYLPHGYLEHFDRIKHRQNHQKDIDVLFTGTLTSYRKEIKDALETSGLNVRFESIITPDYIREDLISRAKVVVNLKQNPNWPFPSNSRFHFHISNRSMLVTEKCKENCDLDKYVIHVGSDNFALGVKNIIESGNYQEIAFENYQRFKNERPMKQLMAQLLLDTFK